VSDTLDDAHAAKTLTHEVAHIQCEHVTDMHAHRQHRGRMEIEAESVAYIVAAVCGLDPAAYSGHGAAQAVDGGLLVRVGRVTGAPWAWAKRRKYRTSG
jgi:hypothetical protein